MTLILKSLDLLPTKKRMLKGKGWYIWDLFPKPLSWQALGPGFLSLPAHLLCVSSPSHWWWTWLAQSLKSPPAWLWCGTAWRSEAWNLEPASDPAERRWHRRCWSHPCSMAPWVPCTVCEGQGPCPSLCRRKERHIRLTFNQGVPAGPTLPHGWGSSAPLGFSRGRFHSKS